MEGLNHILEHNKFIEQLNNRDKTVNETDSIRNGFIKRLDDIVSDLVHNDVIYDYNTLLKGLLEYLEPQGVTLHLMSHESYLDGDYLTDNEKYIIDNKIPCPNEESYQKLHTSLSPMGPIYLEHRSDIINTVDGYRCLPAADGLEFQENDIYIFGASSAFGWGVRDDETFANYLQQLVIDNNLSYNVFLRGFAGINFETIIYEISQYHFQPGDKIIIYSPISNNIYERCSGVDKRLFSMTTFDDRDKTKDLYLDYYNHLTPYGYNMVADDIYDTLFTNPLYTDLTDLVNEEFTEEESIDYNTYIDTYKNIIISSIIYRNNWDNYLLELKELTKQFSKDDRIGLFVTKASPFTLGHCYLTEFAKQQCDHLFLVLTSEDDERLEFNYEERIAMAKDNCAKISNDITVIRSGRIVASSITTPIYLYDPDRRFIPLDVTTTDLYIGMVAKALNATSFCIGEETHYIMKERNKHAKLYFPTIGMEVIEIPRKTIGNVPVSATYVREAIAEKDWDKLKKFVSDETFKYCKKFMG